MIERFVRAFQADIDFESYVLSKASRRRVCSLRNAAKNLHVDVACISNACKKGTIVTPDPLVCIKCGLVPVRLLGLLCPSCSRAESEPRKARVREHRVKTKRSTVRNSRIGTTVIVYTMRCFNGHTRRTEVAVADDVGALRDPTCPKCNAESLTERRLRATITNTKCRSGCWTARGDTECHCSCGGVNHSRPPADQPDAGPLP